MKLFLQIVGFIVIILCLCGLFGFLLPDMLSAANDFSVIGGVFIIILIIAGGGVVLFNTGKKLIQKANKSELNAN